MRKVNEISGVSFGSIVGLYGAYGSLSDGTAFFIEHINMRWEQVYMLAQCIGFITFLYIIAMIAPRLWSFAQGFVPRPNIVLLDAVVYIAQDSLYGKNDTRYEGKIPSISPLLSKIDSGCIPVWGVLSSSKTSDLIRIKKVKNKNKLAGERVQFGDLEPSKIKGIYFGDQLYRNIQVDRKRLYKEFPSWRVAEIEEVA